MGEEEIMARLESGKSEEGTRIRKIASARIAFFDAKNARLGDRNELC